MKRSKSNKTIIGNLHLFLFNALKKLYNSYGIDFDEEIQQEIWLKASE